MILRALYRGIFIDRMKCDGMNFFDAIKEGLHMIRKVMGLKLYVKYSTGTAIEGKDFITLEDN